MKMTTNAGVELTEKQQKCVESFSRLMKKWDKDLEINAIAGVLHIMLRAEAKQNPASNWSHGDIHGNGSFNPDNQITSYVDIYSDGGDW